MHKVLNHHSIIRYSWTGCICIVALKTKSSHVSDLNTCD